MSIRFNKSIILSVIFLVSGCSSENINLNKPLNTVPDDQELNFSVKGIRADYLKRKLDKWAVAANGPKALKELSFGMRKHPAFLRYLRASSPATFTTLTSLQEVSGKIASDPVFGGFMNRLP